MEPNEAEIHAFLEVNRCCLPRCLRWFPGFSSHDNQHGVPVFLAVPYSVRPQRPSGCGRSDLCANPGAHVLGRLSSRILSMSHVHRTQGEALPGKRYSVVSEYVLRVLGLDYIDGTFVGGAPPCNSIKPSNGVFK